jgi:ferric-dicitrate binding protein FerR (iron transport regulator)
MNNKWPSDELLARWLNRELTDKEQQAWQEDKSLEGITRIIHQTDGFEVPARRTEAQAWELLQARIHTEQARVDPPATATVKPLWATRPTAWLTVAAAAAIALLAVAFWWQQPTRIITADGETKELTLPDNSRVTLNENSELAYYPGQWASNPSLSLQGEAFFDVAPGQSHAENFAVETPQGVVNVLGTAFSVFTRNEELTIACYEGKVSIDLTGDTEGKELVAGNFLEKIGAGSANFRKLNGMSSPGWMEGVFRYDRAPLSEVLAELGRRYEVTFVYDPKVDASITFSGVFPYDRSHPNPDQQRKQALDMVIRTVGYQWNGDQVIHISP